MTHVSAGVHAAASYPRISPRLDGRSNILLNSTCYSGCQLQNDGDEYEYSSVGGLTNLTTWLDANLAETVWVSRSISAGSFNSIDPGTGRHKLDTTRSFRVIRTSVGIQSCTATFSFYDRATGGNTMLTTSSSVWSAEYDFEACPLCCFTPDTPVTLASGIEMPIGKVQVGDKIMVWDVETNHQVAQVVEEVIVRHDRVMYEVELEDGRSVRCSDDHPFHVKGKGPSSINPQFDYKNIGKPQMLQVGDKVSLQDTTLVKVKNIRAIDYEGPVYTFSNSLFYANGILVY